MSRPSAQQSTYSTSLVRPSPHRRTAYKQCSRVEYDAMPAVSSKLSAHSSHRSHFIATSHFSLQYASDCSLLPLPHLHLPAPPIQQQTHSPAAQLPQPYHLSLSSALSLSIWSCQSIRYSSKFRSAVGPVVGHCPPTTSYVIRPQWVRVTWQ